MRGIEVRRHERLAESPPASWSLRRYEKGGLVRSGGPRFSKES